MHTGQEVIAKGTSIIKRGAFIVFEGLDRSGKSTQSANLARYLRDELQIPVKSINFPNRESESGKMLNQYLQNRDFKFSDEAIHLLFAANRWEMKEQILQDLKEGTTLICDRYAFSGVAYSAAKGLDFEWCKAPDRGLVKPDLTFFIDANAETISSRANYGEERYEKVDFQRKVAEAYGKFKAEGTHDDHWVTVKADGRTIDDIFQEVLERFVHYRNEEMQRIDLTSMANSLFKNE